MTSSSIGASSYLPRVGSIESETLGSLPTIALRTLYIVKQTLVFSTAFFVATAFTYHIAAALILPASATYLMKLSGVVAIYLFHTIPSLIPKVVARSHFLSLTNPDRQLKDNLSTRQGKEESSSILESFPYEKALRGGFRLAIPTIMLGSLGALQLGLEIPSLRLVCNLLSSWSVKQKLLLLPASYLFDRVFSEESPLLLRNDPLAKKIFERLYRFAAQAELTYEERSYFFRLTLLNLTEKSLNPVRIITSMRDEGYFTEKRIAEKFVDLWNALIFSELNTDGQRSLYISFLRETFFKEGFLKELHHVEDLKISKDFFDTPFTFLEENPTCLSIIEDRFGSFVTSFLALIDIHINSKSEKIALVKKLFNAIKSQHSSTQIKNTSIYNQATEQLSDYLSGQMKIIREELAKHQSVLSDQP